MNTRQREKNLRIAPPLNQRQMYPKRFMPSPTKERIREFLDALDLLFLAVFFGPFCFVFLLLLWPLCKPRTGSRDILALFTEAFEALITVVLGPIRLVRWLLGKLLGVIRPDRGARASSGDPATTTDTKNQETGAVWR